MQAEKKLTSKLVRENELPRETAHGSTENLAIHWKPLGFVERANLNQKRGGSLARTGASTCSAMLLAKQQIIIGSLSPAFCHQPAEMKQSQKAERKSRNKAKVTSNKESQQTTDKKDKAPNKRQNNLQKKRTQKVGKAKATKGNAKEHRRAETTTGARPPSCGSVHCLPN